MSDAPNSVLPDKRADAAHAEAAENSLGPARRRAKPAADQQTATQPRGSKQSARARKSEAAAAIPEEVRRRFVQIKNAYFFADGAKAFTDRGDKLTTPSENTEVVRSLVSIAEARGWSEVVVRGTERFRREAWGAARKAGLEVRGYKPTEFEKERLVRSLAPRPAREASEAGDSASTATSERDHGSTNKKQIEHGPKSRGLLVGALVEHGRAPYRHDMKEPMSYYVKIETPQGDRTIWGVDLERAFKESLSKPVAGDVVGLRAVRQEPVTVKARDRDAEGKLLRERDLDTLRNRWIVEKREFFQERAAAARTLRDPSVDPKQGARQHPELLGTYLQVHAAELAAKQFRDPEDQKRFVDTVREALATSVARGEPLPPVRMKERAPEARTRPARAPEPAHARA